jgi:small subunit ribosomal protein S2
LAILRRTITRSKITEDDVEVLTMKELLETGVHFGHRTRKWNPKMARYIFTERKGIHIIDLEQTVDLFRKAYYYVRDRVGENAEIMFVGTKKQVQATIAEEAQRCGAHYVNRRWLGGTLTNFSTVKQSIDRMKKMETMVEDGTIDSLPNKEASKLRRRLAKLVRNLDGLRNLERKPDLMFVIDPDVEMSAVREANILGIPVIAIVDTNCDPDPIDFLIPGNDDAIKATKLITARIADAVIEGREGLQDTEVKEPIEEVEQEEAPEADEAVAVATGEAIEEEPAEEAPDAEPVAETAAEAEPVAEAEPIAADADEPREETGAEEEAEEEAAEEDADEEAGDEPEEADDDDD